MAALHAEADAWERMADKETDRVLRAAHRRSARHYRRRAIRLAGGDEQ